MWWRKKDRYDPAAELQVAKASHQRADELLARVESQQSEVDERVGRLERRKLTNHFAESMYLTMGRRPDGSVPGRSS